MITASNRSDTARNSSPQPLLTLTSWIEPVGANNNSRSARREVSPDSICAMNASNSRSASAALSQ